MHVVNLTQAIRAAQQPAVQPDDRFFERAARELCRLRGQDPEESVASGMPVDERGIQRLGLVCVPRWRSAERLVRANWQLQEAMRRASLSAEPAVQSSQPNRLTPP